MEKARKVSIVMVDDDEDDCKLIQDALAESELDHNLLVIDSGQELLDYLYRRGKHSGREPGQPDLVLLDLYLPGINGRDLLRLIKQEPRFHSIDVVVLTTSTDWSELSECYQLGATAVFSKGEWMVTFAELIRISGPYWFKFITVRLGTGGYPPRAAQYSADRPTNVEPV